MALAKWGAVLERTLNTTMQTTMKKTIGILVCSLVLGATQLTAADEPNYRAVTIGVDAGTTGFGGSASLRFSDHFGVRGGVNYFSYDTEEFTYSGSMTNGAAVTDKKFNVNLRLMSEPLALDYYPSAKSSFRISLGVLLNQNRFKGSVPTNGLPNTTFDVNDHPYFQSGMPGGLELEVKQMPISPYLSIGGSIYLDKSRHWSLSGELGVAYTGSPKVSLTSPNYDPNNDVGPFPLSESLNAEEESIKKDADKYKFYPIVKIGVSYSF